MQQSQASMYYWVTTLTSQEISFIFIYYLGHIQRPFFATIRALMAYGASINNIKVTVAQVQALNQFDVMSQFCK